MWLYPVSFVVLGCPAINVGYKFSVSFHTAKRLSGI